MEFRILGPLEVWEDGQARPLPGGKPRAVLAVLLLNANQVVSRDRLIDDVWGEQPPETAPTALQGYVSQLRKALAADAIATHPSGYSAAIAPGELDLDRFTALVDEGRAAEPNTAAARLRDALALWRGPALADFAFEPFAQSEIVRLEELRLAALEDRIEADLALGRHADLTGELEGLIARHPLRERLRGQLMLALYRSGRQAEALSVYQDARKVLVEELGIDPSGALQQLEKQILVQDAALDFASLDRPEPVAAQSPVPDVSTSEPQPVPETRELRKTVTIVFSDLVQSTNLWESLDPEALRRLMSRYFETVSAVLERHGGTVEKFIGDAVMAVFGIPAVHEDDALRAVRAAADMRAELERLNGELETTWGVRIATRTGINTGEVIAGDTSGQALVTGDAVNVANRLEQAAGADEILIGEETWRLVRNAVRAEPAGEPELKGRGRSVRAYRLLEVLPDTPGFSRRLDVPLVGRQLELAQLRQALDRAERERRSYLFTLLGSAGIGKSRLVGEFVAGLGERATALSGRCLPYGEGITFWPLAEVLRQAFGDDVRAGALAALEGEADSDRIAELVEGAVGRSGASATGEETFWAVRALLEALARERPLVLVVEDVHWAEPTLLDLVEYLADWTRDAPLLVLCLARPELLDQRPGWAGGKLNAVSILLEPLSDDESGALIDELLGSSELDRNARKRIADAAEGNPLFVEQMLAMLAEDGGTEDGLLVPPTIQALLAARLDRLGPGERAAMEAAAVVGKEFWLGAVEELLPFTARESARTHLLALVRKELIRPDRSLFAGEEAFRFGHILIQDAAYRGMAKEQRADLHERFADWLRRAAGEDGAEYDEIVGYHLEQAVTYRRQLGLLSERDRELAQRAGGLLASAGRRALNRDDMPTAANLLGRALVLLPDEVPARLELSLELAEAVSAVGDLREAEALLRATAEQAAAAGNNGLRTHAELDVLLLRNLIDPDFDASVLLDAAEGAIPTFERLADERGLAKAWRAVAEVHLTGCRWGQSAEALERALEHARRSGDQRELNVALTHLANSLYWGPTPVSEATARCEEILELGAGRLTVEANVLCYLGGLRAMAGDADGGLELIARGREIFDRLGHRRGAANQSVVAGPTRLLAGDASGAEAELRTARETLEAMGDTGILASVTALLAEAVYAQGRYDEVLALTKMSEAAATADDVAAQIGWRAARARALTRLDDAAESERLAREAVELAEGTDFLNMQADALLALAEVVVAERDGLVERALERHREKGNLAAAERAAEWARGQGRVENAAISE